MSNKPNLYRVLWTQPALKALAKLFNVSHNDVFNRSKLILSQDPHQQADGVTDYSDFKYNGYYWVLLHNVVLIYTISETKEAVRIRACYFANTESSHQIFWGIEPEEEELR
ncbi:hypothetical protein BK133_30410 [Paenibacillus sp. FSL H8-0548]|uniref:hypothetical protein n=1 Tax=Paenibacillus sp. FSL H8-0548 TaxID=1920422 RepID=UPI00096D1537|nr:hypothetical protein [Paenibacillus sp. FSL H8-0548]OMF18533.1 hypothetical protein BK133_30410 [Paenibacillus sp. FSL H8-0548]